MANPNPVGGLMLGANKYYQKVKTWAIDHKTALKVAAVIVAILLVLGAAALTIHYTMGFSNLGAWLKNTALPWLNNTHLTVAQGMGYFLGIPLGVAVVSFLGYKYIPGLCKGKNTVKIDLFNETGSAQEGDQKSGTDSSDDSGDDNK